jgi:polyferredoxin
MAAQPSIPPASPRKKLTRRTGPDASQRLRRTVQLLFFALNVWIGVEFYLFVRFYESGGRTTWAERPPGVEGWLPIAALMNLKAFVVTGAMPAVHPAGMFLFVAFAAISVLFRKAFCSWLCPVGTISEALAAAGKRIFGRNFRLPRRPDLALRSVKYVLLGFFLFAVASMSAAAIQAFLGGPYGVIADVKMLNFFRYLGAGGIVTLALLGVASMLVENFWCRYLCPYGALLGIAALASPMRIRREPQACIDCAKCAKACPSLLPVDRLITVKSAECTACLECVAVCPAADALAMSIPRKRRVPSWAIAVGTTAVFLALVACAQWTGYWRTDVPGSTYSDLIPRAQEFTHP